MPSFYDVMQAMQQLPYQNMADGNKDASLKPISAEEMGSAVREEPSPEEIVKKQQFMFDPRWGFAPVPSR
jgi:hypothetical protein